jgi:hypothetical protein
MKSMWEEVQCSSFNQEKEPPPYPPIPTNHMKENNRLGRIQAPQLYTFNKSKIKEGGAPTPLPPVHMHMWLM